MHGTRFTAFIPEKENAPFDKLLSIFMELLPYTAGDVSEALSWMTELDKQYKLTDKSYGMGDFITDLKEKGYIKDNPDNDKFSLSSKSERTIRKRALEEIFGKLKKSNTGNHKTSFNGQGDEWTSDLRPFQFGDNIDSINFTQSLQNAQINHGPDEFNLTENDLEIQEKEFKTQHSTVLMIDISHSMILYGEDRITPARKVAMALAELISIKYPKDTLDIIAFGDDAFPIAIKDLPYLQVGPYHTNTTAGLQLAMELLRRKKTQNKQIFMITDGKPTCIKSGASYYKNSFGLDQKIINSVFSLASQCRKQKIPITTFMIATDPYLQQFVRQMTAINKGRAFYSSLNGLGEFVFEDYVKNRKKRVL